MKTNKWLTYSLGILLTLAVLVVVAGTGFRIGVTQNASFSRPAFAHNFDGDFKSMQGNFHDNGRPQAMQGNPHNQGFDNRGNNRGDDRGGGISFFSPIFGLIRLVILGLLLWIGYKFVKNSGWRLIRATASPAHAPSTSGSETPSVDIEEKKEEA